MDVTFKPGASTLEAAWELQSWRDSSKPEVVPNSTPSEATPAPPDTAQVAKLESLLPSNVPTPKAESSLIDESSEGINHDDTSALVGSSNASFHGSDAHMSTSQCNGSTNVNSLDSMDTTPESSAFLNHIPDASPISNTVQPKRQLEDFGALLAIGTLRQTDSQLQDVQLLEAHHWIRCQALHGSSNARIYVDPRLAHQNNTQRSIKNLRNAFKVVMSKIDPSPEAWHGERDSTNPEALSSGEDEESLWYIFNTLQDPNPQVDTVKDGPSRKAMSYLLSDEDFSDYGLKTALYPYQRRSAAMMVQREVQPARMPDPRLQACSSPMGLEYFYDKEDGWITLQKEMYDEAVGGILAETMGCGKTLICLAVIWATRGHFPKIPIEYLPEIPVREKTASLMEMAAAAAGRKSLPWKAHFLETEQDGQLYSRCVKACETNRGFYEIAPPAIRHQVRLTTTFTRPPPKRIRLCSGTLVIAPNNLVDHWVREIGVHTEGLKIRVLRQGADKTPSADELLEFDIVLFSKTRFEREVGEPVNNRRNTYIQVDSPLTELHWLRVIVDEGHNVAGHGSKTNMIHMLGQLHFERRWVISGTPSDNLIGLEVSLASHEAYTSDTESPEEIAAAVLQGRKKTGNASERELKDLDRLRRMVIEFLDLKPWSNCPADWTKYVKPKGKDGTRRKSPAIRATLQGLVVRHQDDTVNREITLPKLYNKTVHLEPTFHDRLSINLFLFGLAVNSITSERQGPDYIFDPSNRRHLNQTITNLRQAGFWWAGSETDPQETINHALKYMEANRDKMRPPDIEQLSRGMDIARLALECSSWREFKQLHELGVFIRDFPADHKAHWALDRANPDREPLLMGITQARHAQQFVTEHLRAHDPSDGLSSRGLRVRFELQKRDKGATATKGAPESTNTSAVPGQMSHGARPKSNKSPKKTYSRKILRSLSEASPLMKTHFIATASAKLTYLLDRVWELQRQEKIIIFYDNPNTAFWIAEGLELLGIEFRIYASTLKTDLREEYLNLFRETSEVRVLLMDLRQASHGLHLVQASRVFIVNPIWQPTVESQAIKRAHRLGQTRPVYVETLVLRDTLEDRMLRRRKEMSEAEMQNAEKSLLDDHAMSDIIQREPFLAMPVEGDSEMALLQHATGFFDKHSLPIPDEEVEGKRDLLKRTQQIEESDADSDAFPPVSPTPKRPRIGFASSVQVIEDMDGPLPKGSPKKSPERRVSLFNPGV
ncbi:hypothetical protein N7523_007282 [Penicillium sp. IBT 18751x]|nr:hypothetical protein N7523_007282 [Penicillium sp. IBT 18751x]